MLTPFGVRSINTSTISASIPQVVNNTNAANSSVQIGSAMLHDGFTLRRRRAGRPVSCVLPPTVQPSPVRRLQHTTVGACVRNECKRWSGGVAVSVPNHDGREDDAHALHQVTHHVQRRRTHVDVGLLVGEAH